MPKHLPQRLQPDSISEFRAAARLRFDDASILHQNGRRSAAIYLFRYAAEMILKAAFFEHSGYLKTQQITRTDLRIGLATGQNQGSTSNANLHHLGLWAQAIVNLRASTPGLAYADPNFGSTLTAKSFAIYRTWREYIRYHKNKAYPHEVARVRHDVAWLLIHSLDL